MKAMAKKKPKPVDEKRAEKLAALQSALGLTNEQMAEQFGVGLRTYLSWKYRERNLSKPAVKIMELLARPR